MLLAGYDTHGYLRPLYQLVSIEVAQLETCYQQTAQRRVQLLLCQQTGFYCLGQRLVYAATLHVSTCNDGTG